MPQRLKTCDFMLLWPRHLKASDISLLCDEFLTRRRKPRPASGPITRAHEAEPAVPSSPVARGPGRGSTGQIAGERAVRGEQFCLQRCVFRSQKSNTSARTWLSPRLSAPCYPRPLWARELGDPAPQYLGREVAENEPAACPSRGVCAPSGTCTSPGRTRSVTFPHGFSSHQHRGSTEPA